MIITLLITIGILLILYVLLPLYLHRGSRILRTDSRTDQLDLLLQEKSKLYSDIRDLDFEHGIGKMADSDYQYLRSEAIKDVAEVIQKIEGMQKPIDGNGHVSDDVIEQWVLSRRKTGQREVSLAECPTCHEQSIASAKFCMHCGGAMK